MKQVDAAIFSHMLTWSKPRPEHGPTKTHRTQTDKQVYNTNNKDPQISTKIHKDQQKNISHHNPVSWATQYTWIYLDALCKVHSSVWTNQALELAIWVSATPHLFAHQLATNIKITNELNSCSWAARQEGRQAKTTSLCVHSSLGTSSLAATAGSYWGRRWYFLSLRLLDFDSFDLNKMSYKVHQNISNIIKQWEIHGTYEADWIQLRELPLADAPP